MSKRIVISEEDKKGILGLYSSILKEYDYKNFNGDILSSPDGNKYKINYVSPDKKIAGNFYIQTQKLKPNRPINNQGLNIFSGNETFTFFCKTSKIKDSNNIEKQLDYHRDLDKTTKFVADFKSIICDIQ